MDLKLFNTLAKKKEIFTPIEKGRVSMYACGPTVYDYAHIGNFRTYIFEDILYRVLKYNGYKVIYVQNITDVGHLVGDDDSGEDKIEKGSRERGKTAQEIASFFTDRYQADSKRLNILPPTIFAKATEHISEQIEFIKNLEAKDYTYKTSDGVYFDTSKISDYGKLANLKVEKLKEGVRIEINPEKRNLTDFALWKFSIPKNLTIGEIRKLPKRQMEWDSPWGVGFPGWHIECSAMSIKYLGEHFDIHAGGTDFIPLHHTNEIAQNEAVYKHKTVNYWLHGAFLLVDGKKMSKSLKNTYTLEDLLKSGIEPLVFRYFTFNAHYRQILDFSLAGARQANNSFQNLVNHLSQLVKEKNISIEKDFGNDFGINAKKWKNNFLETVNDDLNIPKAMAVMHKMLEDKNLEFQEKVFLAFDFDNIFGLDLKNKVKNQLENKKSVPQNIIDLAEDREIARKQNNWQEADVIREKIKILGYKIIDSDNGYEITKLD